MLALRARLAGLVRPAAAARAVAPLRALGTAPNPTESFLGGASRSYVEEMLEAWKADPASVHKSWDSYFRLLSQGVPPGAAFQPPPTLRATGADFAAARVQQPAAATGDGVSYEALEKEIKDHIKVVHLIRAYQVRGHHLANLDPLGILDADLSPTHPPELELSSYGFTEKDLDRKFVLGSQQVAGLLAVDRAMTLREIIDRLRSLYCQSVGAEYMHIPSREECNWIRTRLELPKPQLTKEQRAVILDRLTWADMFERFVAKKWSSEKRFGLEGAEALIPGMKALIDTAAELGTDAVIMGMPHRGRLNVLSNVVRKPNEAIFNEFSGSQDPSDSFSGDVKYHLGMSFDRPTLSGKTVHLSLVANPSHLEAVNPVVMGKVRAMQYYDDDIDRNKKVAVLLHGDAAFAGQGIVYESLGLTNLPSYTTGGVIHIVVNNQIGFTTDPRFSRSTPYCTDIALSIQAPVFHVNGDDVEAVVWACSLAAEYRHKFHKDAIIDIVCYRRHGHNEIDQPSFTQPRMYQVIGKHPSTYELYKKKLIEEGAFTAEEIQGIADKVERHMQESYDKSKNYKQEPSSWTTSKWMIEGFKSMRDNAVEVSPARNTGVSLDMLKNIGMAISTAPEDFSLHDGLVKIMKAKYKTIETGKDVDMPTAEGLAFGSLLLEGYHVRLSGQDVERGTFSQRHAVLHDQVNERLYIPLNNLGKIGNQEQCVRARSCCIVPAHPSRNSFTVTNSHLSEYAVMGFELGYSLVNPNSLVLWEAQFGDFANTAQAMIDQFLVSGEKKWLQRSGLVLLLPHGYDGAGPEHSSGRMERFLQTCDDNPFVIPEMDETRRRQIQDCNIQVCYVSTPANYFHVLRRQVHRDFRKPLILFTSKALLRLPSARSELSEMAAGTQFKRVIPDDGAALKVREKDVKRLIFCSGQVYYQLFKTRQENNLGDVAIARLEQISPFPYDLVRQEAARFPNAKIVWCQEEPLNAGAWTYVDPRLRNALKRDVAYAGRTASASPATGNKKQHIKEEKELLTSAFLDQARSDLPLRNGVPVFA